MIIGFLLLDSYIKAIDQLPSDRQWPFLKALVSYRFEGKEPTFDSPLERMAFTVIKPTIDSVAERYEKAVTDGQKGGRPKKWIDRKEEEEAYARLGNWDAVAKELNVSDDTLRKARTKWRDSIKPEKPKNPNVNVNDNVNANVNVNVNENVNANSHLHEQINNKEKSVTAPPPAPKGAASPLPLMPGYEFDRPDGRYRINDEGRAIRIAGEPK